MSKCTRKGRVVYNRKKHPFTLMRVSNILESLSNTMSRTEIERNPFITNALFEIVRTAFYPAWQKSQNPVMKRTIAKTLGEEVENALRDYYKAKVFELCHSIGEEVGVPSKIRDGVIDYLGDFIWDVVWKITDPIFK